VWDGFALSHQLLDTTIAWTAFTFPTGVHGGTRLFWRVIATSSLAVSSRRRGRPADARPGRRC